MNTRHYMLLALLSVFAAPAYASETTLPGTDAAPSLAQCPSEFAASETTSTGTVVSGTATSFAQRLSKIANSVKETVKAQSSAVQDKLRSVRSSAINRAKAIAATAQAKSENAASYVQAHRKEASIVAAAVITVCGLSYLAYKHFAKKKHTSISKKSNQKKRN